MSGATLLDGSALRDRVIADLATLLGRPEAGGVCLATVIVGDDDASRRYVALKHRAAERAGLVTRGVVLPGDVAEDRLVDVVAGLSADPAVHGILVQLPLPTGVDQAAVLDAIAPVKDIDGLGASAQAALLRDRPIHVPPTALGILRLLDTHGIPTDGRVAILGRSLLVGLPLAVLLSAPDRRATVTVVDLAGGDAAEPRHAGGDASLAELCRSADVVVADANRPHLVTGDWVRRGAAVVDVGVSRPGGVLTGDVEPVSVAAMAGALAPNPGGAGPMTVACLLTNTVDAARSAGVEGLVAASEDQPWHR